MAKRNKNEVLYSNYKMLSPDGQLMCRIGKKKFNWYLKRDLAYVPEDDPQSIVLKFEPAGLGNSKRPCELAYKKNICVVCGETDLEELTKHHIVPYCFRKHFPIEHKEHKDYDVLLLCRKCHDEYEKSAAKIKQKISKEYMKSILGNYYYDLAKTTRINRQASALLKYKNQIPRVRKKEMINNIRNFLGKKVIAIDDIKKVASMNVDKTRKEWAAYAVEQCGDIQSFIVEWRQHFVSTMKPQFLPDFWEDAIIE